MRLAVFQEGWPKEGTDDFGDFRMAGSLQFAFLEEKVMGAGFGAFC